MTGNAVTFLDSDDAYMPDYIEAMVSAMERENVELVLCKRSVVRTTGRLLDASCTVIGPRIEEGLYDRKSALRALVDGAINHGVWNKLYRRRLWSEIRFPEGHVYEDVDTAYRILDLCENVYVMNKPLYLYRNRPGSITETRSPRHCQDWVLARSHLEAFVKENIPEVFTQEHLKRCRQARLNEMIGYYLKFLPGKDEKEFYDELRQIGGIIGSENCGIRTKVCYWIIRFCPRGLRLLYQAYCFVRHRAW